MDWSIKSAGFLEMGIVFWTNKNFEKKTKFSLKDCVVTKKILMMEEQLGSLREMKKKLSFFINDWRKNKNERFKIVQTILIPKDFEKKNYIFLLNDRFF